jgi:hypothetical protein
VTRPTERFNTLRALNPGKGALTICAALAFGLVGCGSAEESVQTVTETETVTVEANAESGGPSAEEWCVSAAADELELATTRASEVFQENDRAAFVAASDKVLKLAAPAPEGASCAVNHLEHLAGLWASNFHENSSGQLARVRSFQRAQGLRVASQP